MNDWILFNGNFIKKKDLSYLEVERAFKFGDSWFETMRFESNVLHYWPLHKQRLLNSFPQASPFLNSIPSLIQEAAKKYEWSDFRVRLTVFRIHGATYAPSNQEYSSIIEFSPLQIPDFDQSTIDFSENIILFSKRLFPGKNGNSGAYVAAEIERKERGLSQIILLNEKEEIVETSHANLFWRIADTWFTPHLDTGCVDGIMRKVFISKLQASSIPVFEVQVFKDALLSAEEICVTNAIIGIKNIHLFSNNPLIIDGEKKFNDYV